MIVKVIDLNKLMDRHATWGRKSAFSSQYEVLAIRKWHRKWQYLIENDRNLHWWDVDLFDVIDETIPPNWLTIRYKWFHRFTNKNYDFDISIVFYQGPKAFLDNENFLFDIIENPKVAYEFCQEVMRNQVRAT